MIVCDEPVSALDFLIQEKVLDLLADLKAHLNMSYIFISHDLGLVRHLSDRVIVMRKGASSRPAPGTRYSSTEYRLHQMLDRRSPKSCARRAGQSFIQPL